ncbi:Wzz/FepE/Etk N-terminal domain-containing protein [Streptomyces lavendulae]|uniref:Wzz/FepE/Etk N-terminal domain-containing protein n=1 Tax=Streptomyces lavendulae TaxID=1914 RepID=UPI0024A49A5A|nr:Wzz/FepE/Etk N-terminal domain-containing protein [Streptomyces lavendulae]GLX29107.1 membrane-bound polysaccharide biosynthesis protein [Streptomyces lavendulae subsp. lavendulae]
MTMSTTTEPTHAAPLLDLQTLVVSVRRRRRLWSSLALLGLLIGAAVAVLLPPPPAAVAKVLVAHQQDQPNDPGTLIRTDVALLQTTRIAEEALKALKSSEKPEDFMKDYAGTGLTNNLLQIDVTGTGDAQAVARAKALADAFVADHVRRIREAAEAESKTLLDQRDRLREELDQVNKAIGNGTPESGPKASANTESLFARRAELTARITDFGQRAAEARVGTPQLIAGTQVVDAPRAVRHSLAKAAATDAAIGLVLGLVLGLAVAAVGAVVADRPVLRRDIAANLGVSVITELPRRSAGRLQRRGTRGARERLTASLARSVRGSAEPVSLLELGCAPAAALIALDLAAALAAEGPVSVVDGLPGLRLTHHRRRPAELTVVGGDAPAAPGGERRFGVGSVSPGTAWTDLQYLGTRTVLVVRAGHGSTAWLHTVARQLAEQRITVLGVVLIDPDPRDRTDGTLWDGPRTAPRGQNERPAREDSARGRQTERPPAWAAHVPDSDQEAR